VSGIVLAAPKVTALSTAICMWRRIGKSPMQLWNDTAVLLQDRSWNGCPCLVNWQSGTQDTSFICWSAVQPLAAHLNQFLTTQNVNDSLETRKACSKTKLIWRCETFCLWSGFQIAFNGNLRTFLPCYLQITQKIQIVIEWHMLRR
jgi:hypothetical protein